MSFSQWKERLSNNRVLHKCRRFAVERPHIAKLNQTFTESGLFQWVKNHVSNPLLTWWEKRASKSLIGLDIGSDYIKLLKLSSTNSHYRIENFAMRSLPSGAMSKGEIKDGSIIANILEDMIKQADISSKNVALAIPRASAIIKNILIDSRLNANDIESRAWIEANHYFPDLIGDIYLDFTVAGRSVDDPSQLDVILVACRKDTLKPYLEVIKKSHLNAKIVDVNCYALERALSLMTRQAKNIKTTALLNLDLTLSSFIVVSENNLIYAHDQTFDGKRLLTQTENYFKKSNSNEKIKHATKKTDTSPSIPLSANRPVKKALPDKGAEEQQQRPSKNLGDLALDKDLLTSNIVKVKAIPVHNVGDTHELGNKKSSNEDAYTHILKENLITHLRHMLHFFYSSRPHIDIQQIILTGDCAAIPQLAQFVQHEIGIETLVGNPFIEMSCEEGVNKAELDNLAPRLAVCCGLALSKVN